jgi:GxxExxY protein
VRKIIEPKLSYQITGILFKVHNKLGPLYQEKYYQRAIEKELTAAGIPFEKEKSIPIGYENNNVGRYSLDFVVDNRIVLEIKTLKYLHPKYVNQVLGYLNALQIQLGIIANFKKDKLELKRLILPDKYLKSH